MGARLSSRKGNPTPPDKTPSSVNEVNDKDRAILDLKRARDKLRRFRVKLEADSSALEDRAKALIREKKNDKAMFVLKLKKFKRKEAENVEGQLSKVLERIGTINWEEQNAAVVQALQCGTQALNKMHEELPLEQVESILEDNATALERQASITEVLTHGLDAQDSDELNKEYATLVASMTITPTETTAEITLPAAPTKPVVGLPAVPSREIVAEEAPPAVAAV